MGSPFAFFFFVRFCFLTLLYLFPEPKHVKTQGERETAIHMQASEKALREDATHAGKGKKRARDDGSDNDVVKRGRCARDVGAAEKPAVPLHMFRLDEATQAALLEYGHKDTTDIVLSSPFADTDSKTAGAYRLPLFTTCAARPGMALKAFPVSL